MSGVERKRIRIDWEELEEAFADSSTDHRYYLDRETGAVHFFSAYLDNEGEEADERAITSEDRYVAIPLSLRTVPANELAEFVQSLEPERERSRLESFLGAPEAHRRIEEAVAEMPAVEGQWSRFLRERVALRVRSWLAEVGIEPLD